MTIGWTALSVRAENASGFVCGHSMAHLQRKLKFSFRVPRTNWNYIHLKSVRTPTGAHFNFVGVNVISFAFETVHIPSNWCHQHHPVWGRRFDSNFPQDSKHLIGLFNLWFDYGEMGANAVHDTIFAWFISHSVYVSVISVRMCKYTKHILRNNEQVRGVHFATKMPHRKISDEDGNQQKSAPMWNGPVATKNRKPQREK